MMNSSAFPIDSTLPHAKRQSPLQNINLPLEARLAKSGLKAVDEARFRELIAAQTFAKSQLLNLNTASIFVNREGRPEFAVLRPRYADQYTNTAGDIGSGDACQTRYFVSFEPAVRCDFYLQLKVKQLLLQSRIVETLRACVKGLVASIGRRKNSGSTTEWHSVRLTSMQV